MNVHLYTALCFQLTAGRSIVQFLYQKPGPEELLVDSCTLTLLQSELSPLDLKMFQWLKTKMFTSYFCQNQNKLFLYKDLNQILTNTKYHLNQYLSSRELTVYYYLQKLHKRHVKLKGWSIGGELNIFLFLRWVKNSKQ